MSTIVVKDNKTILSDATITNKINSINTPTILQSVDDSKIVTAKDTTIQIVRSGIAGPTGPTGASGGEDEVALEKRVDFITGTELYKADAQPGTLDSDATWRIRKITIAADNDIRETWADGNANYDKIWDNRAVYTYST